MSNASSSKSKTLQIPDQGADPAELLARMQQARDNDTHWQSGKAFCLVYHPGEQYAESIRAAYNLFLSENALNPTAFPSLARFESATPERGESETADTGHRGDFYAARFMLRAPGGVAGDRQIFQLLEAVAAEHRWDEVEKILRFAA